MFEVVRYRRGGVSARELAAQLVDLSAQASVQQLRIDNLTGLVPAVMERAAVLSLLESELIHQAPQAAGRLRFIVDVAVAAMTEIATDASR